MLTYLTNKCRVANGLEAIQMQSMHFGNNHFKLRKYSSSVLKDLGGNGFEASVYTIYTIFGLVLPLGIFWDHASYGLWEGLVWGKKIVGG